MGTDEDKSCPTRRLRLSMPPRQRRCPGGSHGSRSVRDALGGTGRILEVGSGGGQDARAARASRAERPVHRCCPGLRGSAPHGRLRGSSAGPADRRSRGPAASRHAVRRCLVVCLPVPCRSRRPRHRAPSARQGDQVRGRIHASFKEGDGEDRPRTAPPMRPGATPTRCGGSLTCVPSLYCGWVVDEVGSHGDKPWLAVRGHRP